MNIKIVVICCMLCMACQFAVCQVYMLKSPDNKIEVTISVDTIITYAVRWKGKTIIYPSALGFEFKNEPAMGTGMVTLSDTLYQVNETWQPVVRNKHARVLNHYSEQEIRLIESNGKRRKMDLFFRAYNDGVAFRYRLYPGEDIRDRAIIKEKTLFNIPGHTKAWVAKYSSYTTAQESEFLPQLLDTLKQQSIAGLPLLIELDKQHYAAITEANINNYPGFYIGATEYKDEKYTGLGVKLSPLPGETEEGIKAYFSHSRLTPWRVIMLGKKPGDLICSEIIQNLNEPNAIKNPGWIKPGMSAWDHWWSGEVKMDMTTIKKYIDFAGQMGWPYMLIDWQWYGPFNTTTADITKPAPQLNMPEILQYARSKNVRCWLWLYSKDVNRNGNYKEAFALYEKWGIAGIKIDFMDRDDQQMVNWYREIIKVAAEHHLMVNFHGAFKPDGINRTYPNMITREGVLGEEYAKFSDRITPRHNVTLPFTRMLAGQMDYTPGGFLNVTKQQFKQQSPTLVMNTRCAELSKFVIYESPFTVFCEHPDNVIGQPGADFLKSLPTVWDNIQVPDGYPGEFIVVAKQHQQNWYIGAMTNETARTLTFPLDFLSPGNYEMEIWEDGKEADTDPRQLKKIKKQVGAGDRVTIKMAGGGGYVAILRPKQ